MEPVRRTLTLACLATALIALAPAAASAAGLGSRLAAAMRPAGGSSGAYVVNATSGKPVLRYRHMTPRILASNTKIYTTAAALARYGVAGRLSTEVRGTGTLEQDGTYRGDLYLVGAGDPTFGSSTFARRSYGGGASVQGLATELEEIGVRRVTGRIYGDESRFDSLRGGPDSRYGISPYVGPAERAVLQPWPGQRDRPRLPVQPARVRGRAAGCGAGAEGHLGQGRAPGQAHARRRHAADQGRLADDGAAGGPDQQAVRQLLRRDAGQGPGAPGQRQGHHRAASGWRRRSPAAWAAAPRA